MNIWRIAGTVAAFCALIIVVFFIFSGKLETLGVYMVFKMIRVASFFALFVFTLVLFPYYWLKMVKMFLSFDLKNRPLISHENSSDIKGILISMGLILLTLWLGKTFFSGVILA